MTKITIQIETGKISLTAPKYITDSLAINAWENDRTKEEETINFLSIILSNKFEVSSKIVEPEGHTVLKINRLFTENKNMPYPHPEHVKTTKKINKTIKKMLKKEGAKEKDFLNMMVKVIAFGATTRKSVCNKDKKTTTVLKEAKKITKVFAKAIAKKDGTFIPLN